MQRTRLRPVMMRMMTRTRAKTMMVTVTSKQHLKEIYKPNIHVHRTKIPQRFSFRMSTECLWATIAVADTI